MIQALILAVAVTAAPVVNLTPEQDAWGEVMYNMALCRDFMPPGQEALILETTSSLKDERSSRMMTYAYSMGLANRNPYKFDAGYCFEVMPELIKKALRITEN